MFGFNKKASKKTDSANGGESSDMPKLSAEIKTRLARGEQMQLLTHKASSSTTRIVDFGKSALSESFNTGQYQIWFSGEIPKGADVVCLFPNHKNPRAQVLCTGDYTYLSTLQKDINERFSLSLANTSAAGPVRFAVCYGKHVYICDNITDTVYVLWARFINRTNLSTTIKTIHRNVPLIVNMDGQSRIKAIFILKDEVREDADLDRVPITERNPVFLFNRHDALFVCEVKKDVLLAQQQHQQQFRQRIHTLSMREALTMVLTPTATDMTRLARQTHNPFADSIDGEKDADDDDGDGVIVDAQDEAVDIFYAGGWPNSTAAAAVMDNFNHSGPDEGSPRSALFVQHVPIGRALQTTSSSADTTPPVMSSEDE